MPPKRQKFRDEEKVEDKEAREKADMVDDVVAFLEYLLENPKKWGDHEFDAITSMICTMGSDPLKYPPPSGQVAAIHRTPRAPTEIQLTKDLAQKLYNRKDIDFDKDIYIQITVASAEMIKTRVVGKCASFRDIDDDEIKYRRWLLNAVDDNNDVLTVRLDSTINSKGVLLTPGAVIKVTSAFSIYWDYGNEYDMRCAIVIRDFSILCQYRWDIPIRSH